MAGSAGRGGATDIRIAEPPSLGSLQFDVLRHHPFLARHAASLGIPEPRITWVYYGGPDLINTALQAGAIDIGAGGLPSLLAIWASTRGTQREVRAMAALSRAPAVLNSRNPTVHSVSDFTDADRIAMPAVKVSSYAILLQMAAARVWGDALYNRLDYLTFSLPSRDATNGLAAHAEDFNAAFTPAPWWLLQLRNKAVHTVLRSGDLIGDASTTAIWTTRAFHDADPKLYRALLDALRDATVFIAMHPAEAIDDYIADSHLPAAEAILLRQSIRAEDLGCNLTPRGTMKWASFMYRIGRIKMMPEGWTDLFWPEIDGLDGS